MVLRVLCGVKGCEETGTVTVHGRVCENHWRFMCEPHAKKSKRKRVPPPAWNTNNDDTATITVPWS